MKKNKAFTLIEVMVCIILTGIVAFFIYTTMLSAHRTYFKLFSVSKQQNDIRYFETLIKKSLSNAEKFYRESATQVRVDYYDTSKNKYRVERYNCGSALEFFDGTLAVDNTAISYMPQYQGYYNYLRSLTSYQYTGVIDILIGYKNADISSLSFANTGNNSNITLTVYEGSSYANALASTPVINNEVILENVNRVQFNVRPGDSNHTNICYVNVIYNRVLDDGEVNYEYMIYTICMKNLFYME